MKVHEVMSRNVRLIAPAQTLQAAARLMAEQDVGALPVGESDRLVGMVTDRDIVVRGVAAGRDVSRAAVREVMSSNINYCFEDEDLEKVAEKMAQLQVRRLPILNRDKRLVGIVSLADISRRADEQTSGSALRGVSQPQGAQQRHSH